MARSDDEGGTRPDARHLDREEIHEVSTGRHFVEDTKTERLSILESLWSRIREDAERDIATEPALATYLTANVLRFHSFDEAASEHLAAQLAEPTFPVRSMKQILVDGFGRSLALCTEIAEDFTALRAHRPPGEPHYAALLEHGGMRGLMTHRFALWLLYTERPSLARHLSARAEALFGHRIDLGARLAGGVVSHGRLRVDGGVVVERGVLLEDGVSLVVHDGGVPRIREGAEIGAHASVLGRLVGRDATVLPSSVVLHDVPNGAIVGGCPARRIDV
jgi:serine O-acetyltransferase